MGNIISIYSKNAFKEYILPVTDNTDYSLFLSHSYFGMQNDLSIDMEVLAGEWYIKGSDNYIVKGLTPDRDRYRIKNNHIISLIGKDNNDFRMIASEVGSLCHAFTKLDVSGIDRITIGCAEDNDIRYSSFDLVSRYHADLVRGGCQPSDNNSQVCGGSGWTLLNKGSKGVYVDSQHVKEECALDYGSFINIIGLHIICLGDVLAVNESREEVTLSPELMRRVEVYSTSKSHTTSCESISSKSRATVGESISSKSPADTEKPISSQSGAGQNDSAGQQFITNQNGAGQNDVTAVQGSLQYWPVTIEQPVIGVSRWKEVYQEYLDKKEQELKALNDKNRDVMLAAYPSTKDIMLRSGSDENLWDRSRGSSDFLVVRAGTGSIKTLNDVYFEEGKLYLTDRELYDRANEIMEKNSVIEDAAVTYDLNGVNACRLTGEDRGTVINMAGNIVVQLAYHVSPSDLKMAFMSEAGPDNGEAWKEVRWLPHAWSEDMSCRYYARDKAGMAEIIYRLSKVLVSREDLSDEQIADLTRYVVFMAHTEDIAGTVLERYMTSKRYLGFTIITMTGGRRSHAGANEILQDEKEGRGTICGHAAEKALYEPLTASTHFRTEDYTVREYKPDKLDRVAFGRFTRRLAAVKNEASDGVAIIPDFVTLFDTLGIAGPADLSIKDRWAKNRTYDHLRGVLGKGAGNMVRTLDLHERYHGPHALVAGTIGAGKSELLQSYIISLAAEYSPADLNFILIDFKGGGMANTLTGLPHIAGIITNLSGGEAERAILAVKNEIVQRQKLLNEYGINHIDDYVKLYKSGEISKVIPHLIIIVDEFAELRKEKPDFMRDLISVAQTGRSLGIHLVLATQRPRGNVDDDIRSNMRSAICLRVQDRKDSMDVLDRPDAAYITGAGRAYMQVGAGEVFDPFQTAFSGRSRMVSGSKKTGRVLMLTDDGRADVVSAFEGREETESVSQRDLLKEEIIRTAEEIGAHAEDLWLPPLSREIQIEEIEGGDTPYTIGMIDDPENREQYPLTLEFPGSGNIAIVGTPLSGKTTAMKTLLDQIASADSAYSSDVADSQGRPDVYGIDLDSGMMEEYADCGFMKQVVTGQDVLGIEALLRDVEELTERRRTVEGRILQDIESDTEADSDSQASAAAYKPCIVLIDSYEDFRNVAGYKCEAKLAELLREGPGVGITYVISGGGFGLGQISGSVEKNIKTVLSLQQRSRYDYMDTLHTSGIITVPEEDLKGRGLTVIRGRVLEFQIALTR